MKKKEDLIVKLNDLVDLNIIIISVHIARRFFIFGKISRNIVGIMEIVPVGI